MPIFVALLAFLASGATGAAAAALERLSAPGSWPGVSQLIAYDGAIWFVNSDPNQNFNAADIYRYDPGTGTARHQRGLMSQGAGTPAVAGGRLYWPYRDPRSSAMLGEYEVTDGSAWQWHSFTEGSALNVLAMHQCGDLLLAATGGWEGALQASQDGGRTWREAVRLGGSHDDVTQIVDIVEFNGRCIFSGGGMQAGQRVFELVDGTARPVPEWPTAQRIGALTPFNGALYALHESYGARTLWRYDGNQVTQVPLNAPGLPRDLAANGEALFAAVSQGEGGAIWRSADGTDWQLMQALDDERPISILTVGEDVYVGTDNRNGKGALWGPPQPAQTGFGPASVPLQALPASDVEPEALTAALRTVDAALAPKPDYTSYRAGIMGVVLPLALSRDAAAGAAFANRARQPMPDGQVMTFTEHAYSYGDMARWLLLHAMGLNGHGDVRVDWLSTAWTAEPRPSEKYFDTTLAAIWAVARINQRDAATVTALVDRLGKKGDPLWLKGDVIAVLTAITGQQHGHDVNAWSAWWKAARETWPDSAGN